MISHLKGEILHLDLKYAVLEVGGVGYKVYTGTSVLEHLSHNRTLSSLWIYTAVRDDTLDLYGFLTKDDLDFFELLLTISGIGPKSALSILGTASTEIIKEAIYNDDPSYLCKVGGLGKKNAEKIVRELKDKIGIPTAIDSAGAKNQKESSLAIEALMSLGFSAESSRDAIKKVDKTLSTGEQVKAALKLLQ